MLRGSLFAKAEDLNKESRLCGPGHSGSNTKREKTRAAHKLGFTFGKIIGKLAKQLQGSQNAFLPIATN